MKSETVVKLALIFLFLLNMLAGAGLYLENRKSLETRQVLLKEIQELKKEILILKSPIKTLRAKPGVKK